ncbi:MAG: nitroreductase [Clostridium sp.]|nr:nitroreductase [Clostridium sp.]
MQISGEYYNELKKKTEKILREYPYYKMAKEISGVNILKLLNTKECEENKGCLDSEYIDNLIKSVNCVLERLDSDSKRIIDGCYFRDDINNSDLQKELMIDRNKFYRLKKKALEKFMIVLAYLS